MFQWPTAAAGRPSQLFTLVFPGTQRQNFALARGEASPLCVEIINAQTRPQVLSSTALTPPIWLVHSLTIGSHTLSLLHWQTRFSGFLFLVFRWISCCSPRVEHHFHFCCCPAFPLSSLSLLICLLNITTSTEWPAWLWRLSDRPFASSVKVLILIFSQLKRKFLSADFIETFHHRHHITTCALSLDDLPALSHTSFNAPFKQLNCALPDQLHLIAPFSVCNASFSLLLLLWKSLEKDT